MCWIAFRPIHWREHYFFVIRSLKLCLHIMLVNDIAKFLNAKKVRPNENIAADGFDRITEDSDHLLR